MSYTIKTKNNHPLRDSFRIYIITDGEHDFQVVSAKHAFEVGDLIFFYPKVTNILNAISEGFIFKTEAERWEFARNEKIRNRVHK